MMFDNVSKTHWWTEEKINNFQKFFWKRTLRDSLSYTWGNRYIFFNSNKLFPVGRIRVNQQKEFSRMSKILVLWARCRVRPSKSFGKIHVQLRETLFFVSHKFHRFCLLRVIVVLLNFSVYWNYADCRVIDAWTCSIFYQSKLFERFGAAE